jgi:deoxyribodipyrimidine photo-lyase
VVISDDFPCFFLPRMVAAAGRHIKVRFELVDSNGLLPLGAADRIFARAYDFRRFLQKELRPFLVEFPLADPLHRVRLPRLERLPEKILCKWPAADPEQYADDPEQLERFPIDHTVRPTATAGGARAAGKTLTQFMEQKVQRYNEQRNQPESDATSGLSPYLHFGHVAAHQVFAETMQRENWSTNRLAAKATGSAQDW